MKRLFVLGIDLGKAQDPSALAVIEQRWDRPCAALGTVYDVGNVMRWPLGTDYYDIVQQMAKLIRNTPAFEGAYLAIDYGGVGRAVVETFGRELLGRYRLPVTILPIQITAGASQHYVEQDASYNVAKRILISTALMAMNEGRLLFAKQTSEIDIIKDELRNYREKITPANNTTYEAREGKHDDIVLAVALGAWAVETVDRFSRPFHEGPVVYTPGMVLPSDEKEKPPAGTRISPKEHNRRVAEECRRLEEQWDEEDDRLEQERDVWRGSKPNTLRPGSGDWVW